ncbi:MAG: hypothetical protein ACREJ3_19020 [Polyangiaceae bacterium]
MEVSWAETVLGAIFPGSDDTGLADIRGMDVSAYLRALMQQLPFRAALGLRVAIWLAVFAPVAVLGRLVMLVRLGPSDREKVVAALFASRSYPLRSLMMILKTFGALLYAADAGVRTRLSASRAGLGLVALRVEHSKTA